MSEQSSPEKRRSAALPPEVKRLIVECLAMGETPSNTCFLVHQEYPSARLTPQKCEAYDPTKITGRNLSAELRQLFDEKRREYERLCSLRASRVIRVERLLRMADKAEANGHYRLSAQLLECIAKEESNFYARTPREPPPAKVETTPPAGTPNL